MKKIQSFEDIIAWQKARELVVSIYRVMKDQKDYRFRNQLQSAAVSVMNNIAEGYERIGDKQLKQFLYFAKGSCGEVRSMIYVAEDLRMITNEEKVFLYDLSLEISKLLSGFIKKLD